MLVIYCQDKKDKRTLHFGLAGVNYPVNYSPVDCLREFRLQFDKGTYSWLGVK